MSINQTPLDLPWTIKTMMKIALLGLFCLETSLAGRLTKAQLEDWEVRPDLQYLEGLHFVTHPWKQSTRGFACLQLCLYGIREVASKSHHRLFPYNCIRVTNWNPPTVVLSRTLSSLDSWLTTGLETGARQNLPRHLPHRGRTGGAQRGRDFQDEHLGWEYGRHWGT